jgi:saccharopine dehydrogenase-like NADP-dependent oxidoreductase
MEKILVVGAGHIGIAIATLLAQSRKYNICILDSNLENNSLNKLLSIFNQIETITCDVTDTKCLHKQIISHNITAVISCLPYFLTPYVLKACHDLSVHYFDLTEDVKISKETHNLAKSAKCYIVPQCGVAPGMVGIIANDLIDQFDECHEIKIRVGALPEYSANLLHYSITWSIDGLINEYGNICHAVENHELVNLRPLEDLEQLELNGNIYEAFNTSGGLGHLAELYKNKLKHLSYKTIRYPGHAYLMRFLMNDCLLNEDRDTLKKILLNSLPYTEQDTVVIYISADGIKDGKLLQKAYQHQIYPTKILNFTLTAIQYATASGVLSVMDYLLQSKHAYGLVIQETLPWQYIMQNTFATCYQKLKEHN